MTQDEAISRLASTIYAVYFTRDGGHLYEKTDNPVLIEMRNLCWQHAEAFYNEREDENAINERKV